MKRLTLFLCLPLLLVAVFSIPAHAINDVGEITHLRGYAVVRGVQQFRIARPGMRLREGDRILTGANSRMNLRMVDGSRITLGDRTDFVVKSYDYVPSDDIGRAVFGFFKGAFVAITEGISRTSRPDFRVQTPVATMGVRGTTFWGGLQFFDNQLHVALLDGKGVFLENAEGRTEIAQVGYGASAGVGQKPTPASPWHPGKMNAAKASVAW